MKHLALFILLFIFLSGCGKTEKKQTAEEQNNAIPATKNDTTYALRYKFKKGEKFKYKIKSLTDNSQELQTDTLMQTHMTQDVEYILNFYVKNVDTNASTIKVKIVKIKTKANVNGQELKYDSKYIYSTRERKQFLEYESMKNTPFVVKVDRIGKVLEVTDLKQIMKNVLEIQGIPDTLSKKSKKIMKDNLSNAAIIPLVQQIFKTLPEKRVGKDSTWQYTYKSTLATFQIDNLATYRISNIKNEKGIKTAEVNSTLTATWQGQSDVTEKGVHYNFAPPEISGSGNFSFDISNGFLKNSKSTSRVTMIVTVESKNAAGQLKKATRKDFSVTSNSIERL